MPTPRLPLLRTCALVLAMGVAGVAGAADDPLQASLPQRTALHEDPTLDAPLTQLVETWRSGDRTAELIGMYRAHLAQYPQDTNATVVLVRVLLELRDPGAIAAANAAVTAFPEHAFLRWLQFLALSERHDATAVDALAKAVDLETVSWRRTQWTERLITEAVQAGRRDLAERHLATAATSETSAAGKLAVARRQMQAGLTTAALTTLTAAAQADPAPETGIDIQVEAATAEAALDRRPAAAARLDALLAKLGPDHWRRGELTRRRLELAGGETERTALIDAARVRHDAAPSDETATLDYARLLVAADRRRDALAVLTAATANASIDTEILALHARLHDPQGLDAWLAQRLTADPARTDLALRRVRTLIDLGHSDDARALLARTETALPANERSERLLTLARDLRRDGRAADAAHVLERLLAAEPTRMDLAKELAEAWLAAGDRGRAEALIARDLPADTPPEQVLEAVQLQLREHQYRAAQRTIATRLAADGGFFELRIQAIRLAALCGDAAGAERAAAEARPLTDTSARYRLWLDAAVEAAGRERDDVWLTAESTALTQETTAWSATRGERVLAFADICATRDRHAPAVAVLDAVLSNPAVPPATSLDLRRRLLVALVRVPEAAARLPEELDRLAADAPELADDCRARRALLAVPANPTNTPYDHQSVTRALAAVDLNRITDAELAKRMRDVFQRSNDADHMRICLRRLTVLEPAVAAHWENWLENLAEHGDEDGIRTAIRRLLAGIDNLTLTAEVRAALSKRLADSCWRSASLAAAGNDWPGVLALLEQADAVADAPRTHRWIAAARTIALHHLGRIAARDQAMAELAALASKNADKDTKNAATADAVTFPDGLVAGLAELRELCARAPAQPPQPVTRTAPLPPWHVTWSTTTTAPLDGVWITPATVVVATADGTVLGLSRADGRRQWTWSGATPPSAATPSNQANLVPRPRPAVVDTTVVVPSAPGVLALDAATGQPRWASSLIAAHHVVVCADVVVAWDDVAGQAAGFDPTTGRLRWRTAVPGIGTPPMPQGVNQLSPPSIHPASTLVADGTTVLALGGHTALLDARTGALRWRFTTNGIDQPKPTLAATATPPIVFNGPGGGRYGYGPRYGCIIAPNPAPASDSTWTHVVVERLQTWDAVAQLAGDHLLVGGGNQDTQALPTTLPLHARSMPQGFVLGTSGHRLALLNGTVVSIIDLARVDASPITVDVAPWCGTATNTTPSNGPSRTPWISGVVDGRWLWLSGPGGVAAIDLDRAALALHAPWPDGIEGTDSECVVTHNLSGTLVGSDMTSPTEQFDPSTGSQFLSVAAGQRRVGMTGAIAPGLLALPAGTRRLVLLENIDGIDHAR